MPDPTPTVEGVLAPVTLARVRANHEAAQRLQDENKVILSAYLEGAGHDLDALALDGPIDVDTGAYRLVPKTDA